MTQTHIHIRTLVNASKIRHETRDGRKVVIVPSATLPDNIVMNGIRYPAEVIAESFHTLEGTLAPLGHPAVNGKFVSASSPAGLAQGYIGAHNSNVRRENGRVWLDKVIDVEVANRSDGGKAILAAIEKQEPIATSTGLLATLEPLVNAEDGAKFKATSMMFDHDCIEPAGGPAATPEQGVGMFVNAAGEEMDVINSAIPEQELPKEEIMLRNRFLSLIDTIIRGSPEPETVANQETSPMDKEQFDALSGKVEALTNAVAARSEDSRKMVAELIGEALKPVIEAQEAIANAAKAKDEAEHAALVNQVVEAKLLDEATAKATPAATLTVLANSLIQTPRAAFKVNARMADAGGGDRKPLALKSED